MIFLSHYGNGKIGILKYTGMETKNYACFEISSDSIKLLLGRCVGEKVHVLYKERRPLPEGLIERGVIRDEAKLVEEFQKFSAFTSDELKFKATLHEICLVLPPFGLKIYQTNKLTTLSSSDKKVNRMDVANVITQAKNEPIGDNGEVVDIIPALFSLSSGESFANPPLGKESDFLKASLFIHALPRASSNDYLNLATHAGYRVKKSSVAPYCEALLFSLDSSLPATYLLVDIGERCTSCSLIGEHQPYRSHSFYLGGHDLSDFISSKLGVSYEEAEKLKKTYGYCSSLPSFLPSLGKGVKEGSLLEENFTQNDLNEAIKSFFEGYASQLNAAVSALKESVGSDIASLPIVLTGGGSKLKGVAGFFASTLPTHPLSFPKENCIGASVAEYSSCLGLVYASSHYGGTLEDNYHGVAPVSRVARSKKENRKESAEEDNL